MSEEGLSYQRICSGGGNRTRGTREAVLRLTQAAHAGRAALQCWGGYEQGKQAPIAAQCTQPFTGVPGQVLYQRAIPQLLVQGHFDALDSDLDFI